MRPLILAVLLSWAGVSNAASLLYQDDLTPERFPEAAERIRQLMEPGQVHGNLAPTLKRLVSHRLGRIENQLANPHSRDRQQHLALRRHLKSVNDLLVSSRTSASSEVYCRRQQTTNSRLVQVICYDRQEVEEKSFETRLFFNEKATTRAG